MSVNIISVILDLQGALLGAIVPATRAVTIRINEFDKKFEYCFFYDEDVTDELFELATVATAEVGMPLSFMLTEKIEYLDSSKPIPVEGQLVYLRYEPGFSLNIKKLDRKNLVHDPISAEAILLLDMQEALLGKVTPALRQVHVYPEMDLKKLRFTFFYDGAISEFDFSLATSAIKEGNWSFSEFEICYEIVRLDYPNKAPWDGKMRAAYIRCEEFLHH